MTAGSQFIVTQADVPIQSLHAQPKFTSSSPRTVVVINGKDYVPIDIEVNGNAHGATGDATVTLPIGPNPDFSVELQRGSNIPLGNGFTTTDNSPVYIEIFVGFSDAVIRGIADLVPRVRVFFGIVDVYSAVFHDDSVTFTCRSLAAPLVDNEITRVSMNETSLQFAQTAAQVAGLKFVQNLDARFPGTVQGAKVANVSPITIQEVFGAEFVGGYNFAASVYRRKWWDLLLQCAMFDDADVWVDQDTLYYAVPSLIQRTTLDVIYGRDIQIEDGLTGTHSIQFSKNIQVELHTYQRKWRRSSSVKVSTDPLTGGYTTQTYTRDVTSTPIYGTPDIVTTSVSKDGSVTVTSASSGGGANSVKTGEGSESGKMRYVYFVRNLDPARLARLAQSIWRQISEHTYTVELSVPLRPENLTPFNSMTTLLQLSGCPYRNFDSTYYPRSRTLSISNSGGGGWRFQCVNHALPQGAV